MYSKQDLSDALSKQHSVVQSSSGTLYPEGLHKAWLWSGPACLGRAGHSGAPQNWQLGLSPDPGRESVVQLEAAVRTWDAFLRGPPPAHWLVSEPEWWCHTPQSEASGLEGKTTALSQSALGLAFQQQRSPVVASVTTSGSERRGGLSCHHRQPWLDRRLVVTC